MNKRGLRPQLLLLRQIVTQIQRRIAQIGAGVIGDGRRNSCLAEGLGPLREWQLTAVGDWPVDDERPKLIGGIP